MNQRIRGHFPAMLMPLAADGSLDTPRAVAHAQHLIANGCDGVALFGTTGEGPAFTNVERKGLLEAMLGAGLKPGQLVITITASALADAIELGRHAAAHGCHQQMFMPPFYFRQPRAAGVIESVSQVIRGIDDAQLQLLLYHIPGLSSVEFSHTSIATLVQRHPDQVVGVKDSSGSLEHGLALAKAFPELGILVGAEQYVAAVMRAGGAGSINGLSNLAPSLMSRVIAAPSNVSAQDEQLIRDLLAPLSILPNMPFVCVYKTMLAEQTGDDRWLQVRAPLCPLDATEEQAVRKAWRALGAALTRI